MTVNWFYFSGGECLIYTLSIAKLGVILFDFFNTELYDLIYLANFVEWNLIAMASLKPENEVFYAIAWSYCYFLISHVVTVLHSVLKIIRILLVDVPKRIWPLHKVIVKLGKEFWNFFY